jgi:hypothetical protein
MVPTGVESKRMGGAEYARSNEYHYYITSYGFYARYGKETEKISRSWGTVSAAVHLFRVTAETPLPSKRLVIRSRKASVRMRTEAFYVSAAE